MVTQAAVIGQAPRPAALATAIRKASNDLSFGFSAPASLPDEPRFQPPSLLEAISKFRDDAARVGLKLPQNIAADGKFHRFGTKNKSGDTAGWYVLYSNEIPAGAFGDFRTDLNQPWCSVEHNRLTPSERAQVDAAFENAKQLREAALSEMRDEAAVSAAATLKIAMPAPADHPYFVKKGIKPNGALVMHDNMLVIPMIDIEGELRSTQIIYEDGRKQFQFGGQKHGCFFPVGQLDDAPEIAIAEGFATAASIHEATGLPCVVAFDCGNLPPVSEAIRAKYPTAKIIICADDDTATEGNPGLKNARKAASKIGGVVAIPDFGPNRPAGVSDFNDLAALSGKNVVSRIVAAAERTSSNAQEAAREAAIERDFVNGKPLPEFAPEVLALPNGAGRAQRWIAGRQIYLSLPAACVAALATINHVAMHHFTISTPLGALALNEQYMLLGPTGFGKESRSCKTGTSSSGYSLPAVMRSP